MRGRELHHSLDISEFTFEIDEKGRRYIALFMIRQMKKIKHFTKSNDCYNHILLVYEYYSILSL